MRLLICLSVLIAVHQCRHLSDDRRQLKKQVSRKTTELSPADWTDYEPVVVKLEIHFAAKKHGKKRKKMRPLWNDTNGFIHVFLPIQTVQETTTTTTTTTTTPSPPLKKKKNKKKKKKHHLVPKTAVDIMASVDDSKQPSNRLMPLLLQDDGIPPVLNSLSTEETHQWATMLRCTLCLKNGKQQDSTALCQNVECHGSNTTGNELTTSGCQVNADTCSQWQHCESEQDIPSLLTALPPCPCTYPTGLVYNDRVWDPLNRHHYRWREISLQSERVDIYRPGAAYCIRSLSVVSKMALSSQQCCYDDRRRLLTRGWAAGTPALVSPEASIHLSRVTERLPWLACKGDFSRYHLQRPPDNRLNCTVNPTDEEYERQILLATNY